jgi:hypothetical protein
MALEALTQIGGLGLVGAFMVASLSESGTILPAAKSKHWTRHSISETDLMQNGISPAVLQHDAAYTGERFFSRAESGVDTTSDINEKIARLRHHAMQKQQYAPGKMHANFLSARRIWPAHHSRKRIVGVQVLRGSGLERYFRPMDHTISGNMGSPDNLQWQGAAVEYSTPHTWNWRDIWWPPTWHNSGRFLY